MGNAVNHRRTVERVCELCGSTFFVESYVANNRPTRWCSVAHANRALASTRIDHDGRAEAINLYVDCGLTLAQIGDQLGITPQAVAYRLRKAGVARRKGGVKAGTMAPESRARISAGRRLRGKEHHAYKDVPLPELHSAYESGLSTEVIGLRFGVSAGLVGKRLRMSGVQLRPEGFGQFHRAADGHLVQSAWELLVDQWLFTNGLDHDTQPYCPWWKGGKRNRHRADFRVGVTYIEVWGLSGTSAFDGRRRRRMALYEKYGIPAIAIGHKEIAASDFSALVVLLR